MIGGTSTGIGDKFLIPYKGKLKKELHSGVLSHSPWLVTQLNSGSSYQARTKLHCSTWFWWERSYLMPPLQRPPRPRASRCSGAGRCRWLRGKNISKWGKIFLFPPTDAHNDLSLLDVPIVGVWKTWQVFALLVIVYYISVSLCSLCSFVIRLYNCI